MPDQDQQSRVIEPLAKFHARVSTKGRVAIPKETRTFYEIEYGDYVGLVVRKMNPASKLPIKRAFLVARLSTRGQIVLPENLQEELGLTFGEIIEVLLVGVVRTQELLSRAPIPEEYRELITRKGFTIIDEKAEQELFNKFKHIQTH